MPILEAQNISKIYHKAGEAIPVLNNLHIAVERGEILVLMGPSGSGKSTLLNILGTLDSDFSGSLIIDELDLSNTVDITSIRRQKLGFIFQFHHLLPEFTILENLLIPQMITENYSNVPQNVAKEMLKLIGLEERVNHYPNEISGGERQRVAVVRAMINAPSIILADEPTGNLDRDNSQKMLKLMVKLKVKYKQTFIIATHDQSILDIADRVLYLKDGKITKEI
ncbi:MAG TPA: ABC transporter ATP-binding protein [Candidatus Marinimicrobia bacterium]|jgi:ABC-type lipoprotein export system ATPase subunit|nr:ABC transporter ATP-binding protein [Candidatus Neomarinimicrobiota bacterium]HJM83928.1 ABC transporter ATP-binding protein [Candidatus Neomarinimicrobiota bacterium]|tara:strand:+ start:720 stop:1391 length:672 start_codon:yes stop_codon:yes gene_type:complete